MLVVYFIRKSALPICKYINLIKNLCYPLCVTMCTIMMIISITLSSLSAPIDNLEDALSDMSDYFIVGTMRGSFIHKLTTIAEYILKQSVYLQLRVPIIHEKNVIESTIDQEESEEKIGLIDFSRPSDFRLKAIEAKNSGYSIGDEVSHLSGTSKLSTVGTSSSSVSSSRKNTPYEGINT